MTNEYTALHGIMAPGTSVYGYHRGAPVTAQVVESWGLAVGEANDPDADVVAGDLPADAPSAPVVARPDEGANRAAWESYALANGMSTTDVATASMDDLMAAGEKATPAPRKPRSTAKASDAVAVAATEANQG